MTYNLTRKLFGQNNSIRPLCNTIAVERNLSMIFSNVLRKLQMNFQRCFLFELSRKDYSLSFHHIDWIFSKMFSFERYLTRMKWNGLIQNAYDIFIECQNYGDETPDLNSNCSNHIIE